MPLEKDDLDLLACFFRKKVIGKSHRRVDSIAGLCHIRNKKGFKKQLKQLVQYGFLDEFHGSSYSLTDIGWRVGQRWNDGQSIEEIRDSLG
ncbi:MAG: hypothetical protein EAX81_02250, partial [Candidatus Thorarchaeota archaeon]|nr:hypothetical protein [Candidatus Thorarchaeota archaeon]